MRYLNTHLEGKEFLVGTQITLADYCIAALLVTYMQIVLDKNFRKSIPNFTAWFERVIADTNWIKRFGKVQMCEKAMKATCFKI